MGYNAAGTRLTVAIRHGEPGRYWVGQLHGVPPGIAVQQPAGAPLVMAPMPGELAEAVARAVDATNVALPGVFGPAGSRGCLDLGVSRIQAVNTPPERQGRGYASAGVSALSARVPASGLRCVLNVNVTNMAAISVCQRLGYRSVLDMRRYELG